MKTVIKAVFVVMAALLLISLAACGGDDEEKTSTPTISPAANGSPTTPAEPKEKRVITIGVISDITGPSAKAHSLMNMALDDTTRYFNENVLGPGVELKTLYYDGQNDPSKDIPGYQWLKERGADVLFTAQPVTAVTLRPMVERDRMVMFVATGDERIILPPGYVFGLASLPQYEGYALMRWIAENDWDYKSKGPAKVGGASWDDAYGGAIFSAMEEYAKAHPEQFQWVGGYLTPMGTFTWATQVDALKSADYVFPCTIPGNFVREYKQASGKAKFIGAGIHTAFLGMIYDGRLWDEIDGMPILMSNEW
ncbi:MAG: ABC transporter substrate-binding protein [Chloroflexi bacterium]|nr:ABC transporter substrate-binding protein [Chloroflexota bacterium]